MTAFLQATDLRLLVKGGAKVDRQGGVKVDHLSKRMEAIVVGVTGSLTG